MDIQQCHPDVAVRRLFCLVLLLFQTALHYTDILYLVVYIESILYLRLVTASGTLSLVKFTKIWRFFPFIDSYNLLQALFAEYC